MVFESTMCYAEVRGETSRILTPREKIDKEKGFIGCQITDVIEAQFRRVLQCGEVRLVVVASIDRGYIGRAKATRVNQSKWPLSHHVSDRPPHVDDTPALGKPMFRLLVSENASQVYLSGRGVIVHVKIREWLGRELVRVGKVGILY